MKPSLTSRLRMALRVLREPNITVTWHRPEQDELWSFIDGVWTPQAITLAARLQLGASFSSQLTQSC
ncbi:MAG: hypothetical protein KDC10_15565 [Calditrichaeota bacterium]|nr:hypothetical protein [Calditrichota bacterium]